MILRRTALIAMAGMVLAGIPPVVAKVKQSAPLRMFDSDHDGSLDLQETKNAALALFDKLDRDKDGTLDRRELAGRLSIREFGASDPDHDGSLTKEEYLAVVELRFRAADPDNDGTLTASELNTKAGKAVLRLMK